jgi:hypothetical protein
MVKQEHSSQRRLRRIVVALSRGPHGHRRAEARSSVPSQCAAMAREPPPATYTHAPRFAVSQGEAMLEFFHREGYAVIKSVLDKQEASHAMDLTWEYLESAGTGLSRGKPETWHEPAWLGRSPEHGSFVRLQFSLPRSLLCMPRELHCVLADVLPTGLNE